MLLLTDQNPRVLLYAHGLSLLLRMTTVWYGATFHAADPLATWIVSKCRLPTQFDKGRPYRDQRTREPAGIVAYLMGILTLLFMIGILLLLAHGPGFLEPEILVPEVMFGLALAVAFWLEDLFGREYILDAEREVYQNLGFNTSAMSFLMAAIFITGFAFVIGMVTWSVVSDAQPNVLWMSWAMIIVLALLKLGYQLKIDFSNPKGFAHLSKFDK